MQDKIIENIKNKVKRGIDYKPGEYHISELPFCPRRSYYFRKEKVGAELNGKMLAGILVHKLIPDMVKGMPEFEGAQFEVEKKIRYKGVIITGHADILTKDKVYEVKFTGNKVGSISGLPVCYYSQANAYANMFHRDSYALVIIDSYSNVLSADIVEGNADKNAFKLLLEKAVFLEESVQKGWLPDLDYPSFKFECPNCQWVEQCKKDTETEAYL